LIPLEKKRIRELGFSSRSFYEEGRWPFGPLTQEYMDVAMVAFGRKGPSCSLLV